MKYAFYTAFLITYLLCGNVLWAGASDWFVKQQQKEEEERKLAEQKAIEEQLKREEEARKLAEQQRVEEEAKRQLKLSSTTSCQSLKNVIERAGNPFPIADWLNTSQIGDFYQPTFHKLLSKEQYFNSIDSLDQLNLSLEPYGFSSNFTWREEDFKLQTLGVTAEGNMKFQDSWVLGAGIGYWHSNLEWGSQIKDTYINSLFLGPQVTYLLKSGYVQLMLAGIYNMYNVQSEFIESQKSSNEHNGWDILARLSGAVDIEVPFFGEFSVYIQPNLDLSYVGIFPTEYEESGSDEIEISIKSSYADFLRSRLAFQFWKEFYKKELGFLIPSVSIGWIYMQPMSEGTIRAECKDGVEDSTSFSKKHDPTSNQFYVGVKLTAIHKKGFLLALGFDANIAELYPVYMGTLRFEMDW